MLILYLNCLVSFTLVFFFFQAEDGIRDGHVTGVQTCALPICFSGELRGPAETFFVAEFAREFIRVALYVDNCCNDPTENGDACNDHHDNRRETHDTTSCPDSSTEACLPCGSSPSSAYSFSDCSRYSAESFGHGMAIRINARTISATTMPQPKVLTYQLGRPPYGSSAESKLISSLIKV